MTGKRASAITIQLNYRRFPLPTGLRAAEETLALNFRVIFKNKTLQLLRTISSANQSGLAKDFSILAGDTWRFILGIK